MNFLLILLALALSPWLVRLFLWGCRGGRLIEVDPQPAKAEPQAVADWDGFRVAFNGDHYQIEQRTWWPFSGERWAGLEVLIEARDGTDVASFCVAGQPAWITAYPDYAAARVGLNLVIQGAERQERRKRKYWHGVTSEQRPQGEASE